MFKVIVDHEKCNLCGLCVELCPSLVFKNESGKVVVNENLCIGCLGCIPLCPVKAIDVLIDC